MIVGVLALQGDVGEHVSSLTAAMARLHIDDHAIEVRTPEQLESAAALLIPGGESTTISKQLRTSGLRDAIIGFAGYGKSIMGTCAGCILLSKEVEGDPESERTDTLGLMDITVKRNAFGRQKESFERSLVIKGFEGEYEGIFIRAPAITRAGPGVEILAEIPGGIVMARQDNILALTFHPELVGDARVHEYFLTMV
jgi:5'-phosphate synthase pdxT subunit